jgi:predicted DNA-binding transcriptional regulator
MNQEALERMGLNRNEAKVYLALLETGPSFTGPISKEAGINRRSVYDAAKHLIERGLASYVLIRGKRQFQPSNPQRLIEIMREREIGIKEIMPVLESAFSKTRKKMEVEVFKGKEGIKSILNDVVATAPPIFLDISSGMTTILLPHFIPQWHRRRIKAGIVLKILMNATPLGRRRGKQLERMKLTRVGYFPQGLESPSHIYIYGRKVAIAIWVLDHPFAITIENEDVHKRFTEFFEWFWRASVK